MRYSCAPSSRLPGRAVSKSPIYCDNRLILTAPEVRKKVEAAIAETVKAKFPACEVLMGTSTAGIAHAAIAATILDLPMGYVRSGSKDLGFFLLYFNLDTRLLPQTYKLYESFGSHLGIAVDSLRLVEREQQYAVAQERNLMAQGLHDSIAQSLSFLNLQVQLLESGLHTDDKELVDTTVAQIKAGVQESYEDVRELLLNFRERVHTESFSEAINTVIDRFESQTKLPVKLTVTGPEVELTDRQKIQVIFIMQEALANVRKHSKATQVLINIEYGAEFKLSVVDNGIGINKEFQKHIFEEFTREESSTVSGIQGTGLGLSITKNIVDLMGGTITLESEPGKGSEFIVNLCFPLSGQKAEIKQLPQLEGLRALVADDDTNTCLSVSTMLSKIGMRPEWTISGKEAVIRTKYAVEQGDAFSVYIIDWLIPGYERHRDRAADPQGHRGQLPHHHPDRLRLGGYRGRSARRRCDRLLRKAALPLGAAQGAGRTLPGAAGADARPAAQGKL